MSLNRFEFIGRLGKIAVTNGGTSSKRLNLSLAVDGGYYDKAGNWQDRTHWMDLSSFIPNLVERVSAKYMTGDLVYVEGEIHPWRTNNEDGSFKDGGLNLNVHTVRLIDRPEKNKERAAA